MPSSKLQLLTHRDNGLQNVYTRMGTTRDKTSATTVKTYAPMHDGVAEALHGNGGIANIAVEKPLYDMLRSGFDIKDDNNDIFSDIYKDKNIWHYLEEYLRWESVHGMSAILLGIDDGRSFSQPVNEKSIKDLMFMQYYEKSEIRPSNELQNDIKLPNFGEPKYYNIVPNNTGAEPLLVHPSRLIVSTGETVPKKFRAFFNGGGASIYQSILTELINCMTVFQNVESITEDFVQTVLSIDNLDTKLATRGGEEKVLKRLETLNYGRHNLNTILVDKKEDFEKKTSTVTGLDRILQEYAGVVASARMIPISVFLGRSPAGENATGSMDISMYYDRIFWLQNKKLCRPIMYINKILSLSKKISETNGIKNLTPTFRTLYQPTIKETSEAYFNTAKGDEIYMQNRTLLPLEVRNRWNREDPYGAINGGLETLTPETLPDLEDETEPDED